MAPLIRPYRSEDQTIVCKIWWHAHVSAGLTHAEDVTLESLALRLAHEITGGWQVYVAEVDGQIAGFLAINPASAYLHQLFVSPQAQNRGLGLALLEHAKSNCPDGFTLRMDAQNASARRFYLRHGLRTLRSEPHPRFGHLVDVLAWQSTSARPHGSA